MVRRFRCTPFSASSSSPDHNARNKPSALPARWLQLEPPPSPFACPQAATLATTLARGLDDNIRFIHEPRRDLRHRAKRLELANRAIGASHGASPARNRAREVAWQACKVDSQAIRIRADTPCTMQRLVTYCHAKVCLRSSGDAYCSLVRASFPRPALRRMMARMSASSRSYRWSRAWPRSQSARLRLLRAARSLAGTYH